MGIASPSALAAPAGTMASGFVATREAPEAEIRANALAPGGRSVSSAGREEKGDALVAARARADYHDGVKPSRTLLRLVAALALAGCGAGLAHARFAQHVKTNANCYCDGDGATCPYESDGQVTDGGSVEAECGFEVAP